ncbi:hypothetical protein EVG20_g7882 [Dentipellis fragilis]|uniref:Cytochrome P450 n=1 Tax=Dentipellis fragilis TaxID=205917 RepID=A0A4Y9YAE3_9AGAM|nr:hypothetical protein EVG20_g7882 [Dentipellis fragilis]
MLQVIAPGLVLVLVFLLVLSLRKYGSRGSLYPPGPPTLPIVGNLFALPRKHLHLKFTEWARQYGDVISVKAMHQTIIVINTPTLVKEVFDKRGVSSANRPASTLIDLLRPDGLNFGCSHHADNKWATMRKLAQGLLAKDSVKRFETIQHAETTQTMMDFLHRPEDWHLHTNRLVASLTLVMVYGKRAALPSSPDVRDFFHVNHRYMDALDFGKAPPVDLFPVLKYIPKRFAGWKRDLEEIKIFQEALYERLVCDVRARLDRGEENGSFMEEAIRHAEEWGLETPQHLNFLGGTLLEGAENMSPAMQVVILCACAFPDEQRKAAAEIEDIVGTSRVPCMEDLEDLPYTRAFVNECSRFLPIATLGVPHEMVQDQIIDGILYPKDAVVIQNTWYMFHDERYFDKPDEFAPERFLRHPFGIKPGAMDDPARRDNLHFGGGRRVCPGVYLARTTLDLFVAYTFWAFKVSSPPDPATGKPRQPDLTRIAGGLVARPYPFECVFALHSKDRADVLQEEFTLSAECLRPYELELTEEDKKYNATYRDI